MLKKEEKISHLSRENGLKILDKEHPSGKAHGQVPWAHPLFDPFGPAPLLSHPHSSDPTPRVIRSLPCYAPDGAGRILPEWSHGFPPPRFEASTYPRFGCWI